MLKKMANKIITIRNGVEYEHGKQTAAQLAAIKKSDPELYDILTKSVEPIANDNPDTQA